VSRLAWRAAEEIPQQNKRSSGWIRGKEAKTELIHCQHSRHRFRKTAAVYFSVSRNGIIAHLQTKDRGGQAEVHGGSVLSAISFVVYLWLPNVVSYL
jgi:hypothetical protein